MEQESEDGPMGKWPRGDREEPLENRFNLPIQGEVKWARPPQGAPSGPDASKAPAAYEANASASAAQWGLNHGSAQSPFGRFDDPQPSPQRGCVRLVEGDSTEAL